jgi:hypothetical protein
MATENKPACDLDSMREAVEEMKRDAYKNKDPFGILLPTFNYFLVFFFCHILVH